MLGSMLKSGLLLAGVSGLTVSSEITQGQIGWYKQALESGAPRVAPPYVQSDPISGAIAEWKRLQQSDNWPFSDYANFILAHPDWPGETSRRAAARMGAVDDVDHGKVCDRVARVKSSKRSRSTTVRPVRPAARMRPVMRSIRPTATVSISLADIVFPMRPSAR